MSGLLGEDITSLGYVDRSSLSARDLAVLKVWETDVWLHDKNPIQQPFTILPRDALFQILMIENVSRSKLIQIDDIDNRLNPAKQKVDRLQNSKVVINQVNLENDDGVDNERNIGKDVFKLTLQDKSGKMFYAINSNNLPWIGVCMLGSKLIIKSGASFNRGVFIIKDSDCTFLGGINRTWNENKETKLYSYLDSKLKRDSGQNVGTNSNNKKRKK